jgi:hypothetical protein
MTAVVRPLIHLGVEDGQQGFAIWTSAFFISYILLVNVVLLNVAVAVLLEGFLSSMADTDMETKATLGIREYAKISGSLDPLIASFSSFDTEHQLRQMIRKLFKYLDVDASDSVSFSEFKMGLETLDMKPTLSVTEDDWDHFTGHGKYLDDDQTLNAIRFEECMRQELKEYSQRIISHQMRQAIVYCKENTLDYLAHKMQLAEVYAISNQLSDLVRDLNKNGLPLSNSLSSSSGQVGGLKEMRDLLKTLAAEQKQLRMDVLGQQGEWTEVKDLLQQLAHEQTQLRVLVQTKVGGGVEGRAGPPGVRFHAHEEVPTLTSAPYSRIFTVKDAQESAAHYSDTKGGGGDSTKVRFTSASEREECGSTPEEDRHLSVPIREEGSCHLSVPILKELKVGESHFLKFHAVRASGGRDDRSELKKHLESKLSRLRETHGRLVGQKGSQNLVQPQNGNGADCSSSLLN